MATVVNKPVSRETLATVDHKGKPKAVVVTLDRHTISLRLKGVRNRQVDIAVDRLFKEEETSAALRAAGMKTKELQTLAGKLASSKIKNEKLSLEILDGLSDDFIMRVVDHTNKAQRKLNRA